MGCLHATCSFGFYKKIISNHLLVKYSILVSPHCKIGKHLRIEHYFGVVIGNDVIIGDYCKIYQHVTLGQKDGKYPVVGNNVVIYAGAKIIGDVTIGDNTRIGANAVVIMDVPANSVAAGVPAKIL